MTQKITAKKIKSISKLIRDALERPQTEFDPIEHPYVVTATYFPGDIPVDHWLTDDNDRRCYTRAAMDGWWDVSIVDADDPHAPIARAAFTEWKGKVIAERLVVDRPYRGIGFGRQIIDLGGRLWGAPVEGADTFRDQDEVCWNSPSVDDEAA
jgi:GNAT superfamily N-acetyltransferase